MGCYVKGCDGALRGGKDRRHRRKLEFGSYGFCSILFSDLLTRSRVLISTRKGAHE